MTDTETKFDPVWKYGWDRRRGRDANLAGKPFNTAENIDWQMGWEDAQRDRSLDDDASPSRDAPAIRALKRPGGRTTI